MQAPDNFRLPWDSPAWQAESAAWVEQALARHNLRSTGPAEPVRAMAWSKVLRIPTSGGPVYFKCVPQAQMYEAGLTRRLFEISPDDIPPVLAAEPQNGWLLLADGGLRLREIIRAAPDLAVWQALLRQYALLQIRLAGHLPELFALGVPDSSPMLLPELLFELLENTHWLRAEKYQALVQTVRARLPGLLDQCAELSAYGVPISLHHGDFHDGNILTRQGRFRFFDWGDSSLSHPFFSLRTAFISVENTFDLPETRWDTSEDFIQLAEAYLEPWQRFETPQRLRTAWRMSIQLSPLTSIFSWQRALLAASPTQQIEYAQVIPDLVCEWLATLSD